MAKRIVWTAQARADVRRIEQQTAMRILEGLARYTAHDEGDVRQLTGIDPPELRLRIGDYRVRFYNHTDWVEILRVRHRSQAYR